MMAEDKKIITGISIATQMSKAEAILHSQVIPREELYQIRKREGRLSAELQSALRANA